MPSRTFISLRKLKDTAGQYLLQPDVTAYAVFRLFGIPMLVANRIPINGGEMPKRAPENPNEAAACSTVRYRSAVELAHPLTDAIASITANELIAERRTCLIRITMRCSVG